MAVFAGVFAVAANIANAQTAAPASATPQQQQLPGERFLALNPAERYFWYEGAVRTLSTWVASFDKPKGDCIAAWYLRDRDNKRKLIEDEMRRAPETNETVVFLSLVIQACGNIKPATAR